MVATGYVSSSSFNYGSPMSIGIILMPLVDLVGSFYSVQQTQIVICQSDVDTKIISSISGLFWQNGDGPVKELYTWAILVFLWDVCVSECRMCQSQSELSNTSVVHFSKRLVLNACSDGFGLCSDVLDVTKAFKLALAWRRYSVNDLWYEF